jgi:type II secretion system protein G
MKTKQKAFTLIELLVVIAIIGLLAGIVLVALNSARARSRDATRIADIRELQSALELYYSDNGSYPTAAACANGAESTTGGTFSACWTTILSTQYVGKMPSDPLNVPATYGLYYAPWFSPNSYCGYTWTGSSSSYILATRLENPAASSDSCTGTVFGGWDNSSLNYVVGM